MTKGAFSPVDGKAVPEGPAGRWPGRDHRGVRGVIRERVAMAMACAGARWQGIGRRWWQVPAGRVTGTASER